MTLPRMALVRQSFPSTPPVDIPAALRREWEDRGIRPRGRVAVAVGSRGISNLREVVSSVLALLKDAGAAPFIVPAMGSHGAATAEGQREVLAGYSITEDLAPVRPSMETRQVGTTEEGIPVHVSAEALAADGIVIVNRVKPHTDFSGKVGSGIMKMIAIGLGKQRGAAACHGAGGRMGLERAIRTVFRVALAQAPVLCGVAVVENSFHETARVAVLKPAEIERREEELLAEARRLMPRLPFDEIDFLVVDRMGKNITGAGMDPNVIGRSVAGYTSALSYTPPQPPVIRRIFVRDLTPESHGNAIGVGMADFTTKRLVRDMDLKAMYMNALTSLSVQTVKIPIHFENDREGLTGGLSTLALPDPRRARVVRIQDTLNLATVEVSEAYEEAMKERADLAVVRPPAEIKFDAEGNLFPLGE